MIQSLYIVPVTDLQGFLFRVADLESGEVWVTDTHPIYFFLGLGSTLHVDLVHEPWCINTGPYLHLHLQYESPTIHVHRNSRQGRIPNF